MTPLAIGALLAVAAMVWVVAPVFTAETNDDSRGRPTPSAVDDAAEAAIRRWRAPKP
jgi:hypothetical protein